MPFSTPRRFTNPPLVFGTFPSLHASNATLEALFLSHFFPRYIWAYAGIFYWAAMYLTHHHLLDGRWWSVPRHRILPLVLSRRSQGACSPRANRLASTLRVQDEREVVSCSLHKNSMLSARQVRRRKWTSRIALQSRVTPRSLLPCMTAHLRQYLPQRRDSPRRRREAIDIRHLSLV